MPRLYLKYLGRAREGSGPRQLLGLGPRTNNPLAPFGPRSGCSTCAQQHPYGNELSRRVNNGDETLPGVAYTHIQTG